MSKILKKQNVANIILKYAEYKKAKTVWFHTMIGDIAEIKDTTIYDDNGLDKETTFRSLEVVIKVFNVSYIEDSKQLLDNIEVKSLVLFHHSKKDLLKYILIDPTIEVVSKTDKLIKVSGKMIGKWNNITTHFKDYNLYKTDIDQYFKYKTMIHVVKGIINAKYFNKEIIEVLLGVKVIEKLASLNKDFKYAEELDFIKKKIFKFAIANNNIMIVKGPPGTGKTKLITQLIKHFVYHDKEKVILASRTHMALNNVIDNLSITPSSDNYTGIIIEKSSWLEGEKASGDKNTLFVNNVRTRLLENLPQKSKTREYLKRIFNSKSAPSRFLKTSNIFLHPSVFATTITSAKLEKQISKGYDFDNSILIMDEISKSTLVDVFRYGLYAKKIILVGDNMQLGPILQKGYKEFMNILNDEEIKLFKRLFLTSVFDQLYLNDKNKLMLKTTYRNPQYVLNLYNHLAYNGAIESKVISKKPLKFKNKLINQKMIDIYTRGNLLLMNDERAFHEEDKTMSKRSKINLRELEHLKEHMIFLATSLVNKTSNDLAIMFVYRDQFKCFIRENHKEIIYWKKCFKSLKIGTIDQLQGSEADIVFLATTYASEWDLPKTFKYKTQLQDVKRLNVALSRTRHKLIVFLNIKPYKNAPIYHDEKKLQETLGDIFSKFDGQVNYG